MTPQNVATSSPFFRVELFNGRAFLLFRQLAFFRNTGSSGESNTKQTNRHPNQNDDAQNVFQHFSSKFCPGRSAALGCRTPPYNRGYRHPQRHSEIAHRQAKGETAEPP